MIPKRDAKVAIPPGIGLDLVASCLHCGRLVIACHFPATARVAQAVTVVWDPSLAERNQIRRLLAQAEAEREQRPSPEQQFSEAAGVFHQCVAQR